MTIEQAESIGQLDPHGPNWDRDAQGWRIFVQITAGDGTRRFMQSPPYKTQDEAVSAMRDGTYTLEERRGRK